MAFKRCSNLGDILGSNRIENKKVKRHTSKKSLEKTNRVSSELTLYAVNMSLMPKRSRATLQINHTTFIMSLNAKANMLSTLWNVLNVKSNMLGNQNGLLTSD